MRNIIAGFAVFMVAVVGLGVLPAEVAVADEPVDAEPGVLTISSVCESDTYGGVVENRGDAVYFYLDRVAPGITEVVIRNRSGNNNPKPLNCFNGYGPTNKKIERIIIKNGGHLEKVTIGADAFKEATGSLNTGLKSVTLPGPHTLVIEESAFQQMSNVGDCTLETVLFDYRTEVLDIGPNAFSQGDGNVSRAGVATPLRKVEFPARLKSLNIDHNAFAQRPGGHGTSLSEVKFPQGLEELTIGNYAFYQESDGAFGDDRFKYNETSLKEVIFPNSLDVLNIGIGAFSQSAVTLGTNVRLRRVVIPGGMKELRISDKAFYQREFTNDLNDYDFQYVLFDTDEPPAEHIFIGSNLVSTDSNRDAVFAWLGDSKKITEAWDLEDWAPWSPSATDVKLTGIRKIGFDANGGTYDQMGSQPTIFADQYISNNSRISGFDYISGKVTAPNGDVVKYKPVGYEGLRGWCDSDPGSPTSYEEMECTTNFYEIGSKFWPADGVKTLYAVWGGDPNVVIYNGNGDDGNVPEWTSPITTWGEAKIGDADRLTKAGYSFFMWNSEPDGSGMPLRPGNSLLNVYRDYRVYAQWKPSQTYIDYLSNGGEGTMRHTDTRTDEEVKIRECEFTREHHEFVEWYSEEQDEVTVYHPGEVITTPIGGLVLNARWKPDSRSISYDKNLDGATGSMPDQEGGYDQFVKIASPDFWHEDYFFSYWTTEPGGAGKVYLPGQEVQLKENLSLYAQWEEKGVISTAYDIVFHSNNGTGATHTQEHVPRSRFVRLDASPFPEEPGMVFVGWSRSEVEVEPEYHDGQLVYDLTSVDSGGDPQSSSVDLYAVWKPVADVSYTVEFDPNNGEGAAPAQTIRESVPTSLNPNQFTQEGYLFTGWNTSQDGSGLALADGELVTDLAPAKQSVTLYAQWSAQPAAVVYLGNGATSGTTPFTAGATDQSVQVAHNGYIRDHYQFVGWNTDQKGHGTSYAPDESMTLSKGLTLLFAQWVGDPVSVTYEKNSDEAAGTTDPTDGRYGDFGVIKENGFTHAPANHFLYWSTEVDGGGERYYPGDEIFLEKDLTLHAQWTDEEFLSTSYDIVFHSNLNSGQITYQKGLLKSRFSQLQPNLFEAPEGMGLLGWARSPAATEAQYTDRQMVYDLTSVATGGDPDATQVHLYAVWKPIAELSYTVEFDANGADGVMKNQPVPVGKYATLNINTFTQNGAIFTGWKTTEEQGDVDYRNGQVVKDIAEPGQSVRLYAQWFTPQRSICAASYDANEGSGETPTRYFTSGGPITISENGFTNEGKTFEGWNTASDGSRDWYAPGQEVDGLCDPFTMLVFYAQWSQPTGNHCAVSYDSNGGTGITKTEYFPAGSPITLSDNSFTKKNQSFSNWNSSADGGGDTYSPGDKVNDLCEPDAKLTFYAQWEPSNIPPDDNKDDNDGSNEKKNLANTGISVQLPLALAGFLFLIGVAAIARKKRLASR